MSGHIDEHASFLGKLKDRGFVFNTIYDIGANEGAWSREAKKIFPNSRFELFEPLAGQFLGQIENSGVSTIPSLTLHSIALSDTCGIGKIKVLGECGVGSSILVQESDYRSDVTIVDCELWRLDDFVVEKNLPTPQLIKIDTQAAELKILKGAVETIKHTHFILLEAWTRRGYGQGTPLFQEISMWLLEHDFLFYDFLSPSEGRDPCGTLRWFDAAFINKSFRDLTATFPRWAL